MVYPTQMQLLSNNFDMTQEEVKKLHKLHAPEFVRRGGILLHCPDNKMYNIWHNANNEFPDYPEWNYVYTYPLEYTAWHGYKPDEKDIVSCDDLFKYLVKNHYWCDVTFNFGNGVVYEYRPCLLTDRYKFRLVKMWENKF